MSDERKSDAVGKFQDIEDKAKSIVDNLDYLDDLPDAPERTKIPFPYGSDDARPYGWFLKGLCRLP